MLALRGRVQHLVRCGNSVCRMQLSAMAPSRVAAPRGAALTGAACLHNTRQVSGASSSAAALAEPQPQRLAYSLRRRSGRRRCALVQARKAGLFLKELQNIAEEEDVPTITKLQWESPLQIVKYPHPTLRAPNARLNVFDDSLKRLADEMFEIMYEDDGVGLAAPQVGVNVRLMVFNPEGKRGKGKQYILVNPRIVSQNKTLEAGEEGCLSFPEMYAEVERHTRIKIKAQDENGAKVSLTLEDWVARIFQHEFDHLTGTLFVDRMKPPELAKVADKLVEAEEDFLKQNPGVAIRRVAV